LRNEPTYTGVRDNITYMVEWSGTPQGEVPHPTIARGSFPTDFWQEEHYNYQDGYPLSADARMILEVWLGLYQEPAAPIDYPGNMTADLARQILAAPNGAEYERLLMLWRDPDDNFPYFGSSRRLEHYAAPNRPRGWAKAALLAAYEARPRDPGAMPPDFRELLEYWASAPQPAAPAAPAAWAPQPWADSAEERYFRDHMNAVLGREGRDARDNYGENHESWPTWAREVLMGPDEDYDEEDAWVAFDASPAAEAARAASNGWPIYYTRRRNAIRVLVMGREPLALPSVARRVAPEVDVRKPLKRVNVERIKARLPGVNGATAGCSCNVCANLRKAVDGKDPLTARDANQVAAAKEYAEKGRTFGVEIEGFLPKAEAAEAGSLNMHQYLNLKLAEAGLKARGAGGGAAWGVKNDSSLRDGPRGATAIELVSPILRGEDGLQQIAKAAAVLNALGGSVNKSAGLHVHVGAKDLNLEQRRNLLSQFVRYERFFDLILPASRRSNRYANSLREKASATKNKSWKAAEHAILSILAAKTEDELRRVAVWDDHHAALSDARAKHGTFEFRQHSGSMNGEKIINWVRLVTAFVEAAKDKPALPFYSRKLSDEEEMEKFFETFSIPRDLRAYYRKRHAALYANPEDDN
jgi:hypothetical protein